MRETGQGAPTEYGVPAVRLALGLVVVPLAFVAGALLWAGSVQSRLPARLAIHWGADGVANGTATYGGFLLTVLPIAVVLWAIGAGAVLLGRPVRVRFAAERFAMCWCGATTAFIASLAVLTVAVNLDHASARDAKLPAIDILVPLVLAIAGAAIGFVLAGPRPALPAAPIDPSAPAGVPTVAADLASPQARPASPLDVDLSTHPVWHGHVSSTVITGLGVASAIVAVIMVFVLPIVSITFFLVALVSLPFLSISAVVDDDGLHVRFGPLGWPRKHVRIDDVAAVASDLIEPLQWGGWGYRVMPGRSAVVARRGPGMVIELRDGRAFALTIDDPEPGVALLEAYRRAANG